MIGKSEALEAVKKKAACFFRKTCKVKGIYCDDCEDYAVSYIALANAINDLPDQNGWIDSRLPEQEGVYMVWLENGTADIALYMTKTGFCPWYAYHFEECPPEWDAAVVAWKKIEPYVTKVQ